MRLLLLQVGQAGPQRAPKTRGQDGVTLVSCWNHVNSSFYAWLYAHFTRCTHMLKFC